MEFQDKALSAWIAASDFIWTAGEQLFFADKQFKNEPKRCKSARQTRATACPQVRACASAWKPRPLLGMRQGHHRALPSNAGASGLLQGMLPAAQVCGAGGV
jgi:hypothetical protein